MKQYHAFIRVILLLIDMCYYVFIILRQYKWLIKRDEGDVVKMKLVFYGAGNMAQAIFTGIINSNNLEKF